MFESGILVTALAGVITSFVSGFTAWFFARRKYNSEVDNNIIQNMQSSLEFYQKLSDDNKGRLEAVLKRNEVLETEVRELRTQVIRLATSICTDLSCQLRQNTPDYLKQTKNEKTI